MKEGAFLASRGKDAYEGGSFHHVRPRHRWLLGLAEKLIPKPGSRLPSPGACSIARLAVVERIDVDCSGCRICMGSCQDLAGAS